MTRKSRNKGHNQPKRKTSTNPKSPDRLPEKTQNLKKLQSLLSSLEDEEKRDLLIQSFTLETFEGPYPPPAIIDAYNRSVEGAGDKIFEFTKREQEHRHQINRDNSRRLDTQQKIDRDFMEDVKNKDFKEGRLGQIFAFILVVLSLACAFYFGTQKMYYMATVFAVSGLGPVVASFINGRNRRMQLNDNPEEKDK